MSTTSITDASSASPSAASAPPPDAGALAGELISAHTSGAHLDASGLAQTTAKVSSGLDADQGRQLDEEIGARLRRSSMSDAFAFSQAQTGGAQLTPADRVAATDAQTGGARITAADRAGLDATGGARLTAADRTAVVDAQTGGARITDADRVFGARAQTGGAQLTPADRAAVIDPLTGGARLTPADRAGLTGNQATGQPSVDRYAFARSQVGDAAATGAAASVTTGPTGAGRVTADQLRQIMPNAGANADRYVGVLNDAMVAHGITTREQKAAFLGQVSAETGQLHSLTENMNYSAQRIADVWPSRFTAASAQPYAHNSQALGDHVYANRNGNGNEASGDGYTYRGRGFLQVTGRDHYRDAGHEADPESLSDPQTAAEAAGSHWQGAGLNARTRTELDRSDYDEVTRTVNGGHNAAIERWEAYQRGLTALGGG